ncbi:uncharacterized protein LOC114533309 [Dendronephthya gigantea]|uniref:uncharacterized protein LOC114533309 n=1 Tax=Dendronephthya gigantea TaxID=151771 RepID=UPI001069E739|nr:uncharacterized protein LOC114533309 [Dendronephthya gigantea]
MIIKVEYRNLKKKKNLRSRCLILAQLKHDDSSFQFWTGFPNYGSFSALFQYLECALVNKRNWRGSDLLRKVNVTERKRGAPSKLSLEEEFFMVLIRLRLGLTLTDLASRFMLSEGNISKIFTTWINLMYFELKDLCQMPESLDEGKAKHFSNFPNVKIIIDCTEIFTEKPSSLQACKEIYSNYKGHTTFKFLVGIDTHAAVVYVSRAWGGRTSDKHITSNCNDLLDSMKEGDEIMADRGFDIDDVLSVPGVKVIIPDFKGKDRSQMRAVESRRSENIAVARIHVERAIQRIKIYRILRT